MRLTSLFLFFTTLFFLNSNLLLGQCTITSCPNPVIVSGNATWTDGTQGTANGFLSVTGLTLGNVDCLTGDAGLDIYVYQLLPDGTRMAFCNVANSAPDNFIYKFPIGIGPASDCSNTAFPLPDQIIYDHNNNGVNSGMYLCEGGVYEVVIAVYVNDTGAPIDGEQSVFSALNTNQYVELNLGTFFVNYTNEFASPNPFPVPISTASISGPNGETGTMTASCSEDVTLFVEALSYIGRCRVERDAVPNFYPFCDPLDPNMNTGIYSPSIESELENFLSYTINGGTPIIIRDGNSANAGTEAYGGQQTGPGNLPGLGANECYTGLCGARPFPVPDAMCAGDVMVVSLETFDVYTNATVSDQLTITFTGEGCNNCGPTCPTSASISASVDEACGGDMITITGNTTGEGTANFSITESTETITEIADGVAFSLPFNTTCQPITYTFNAAVTCADDGSIITDGSQSVTVTVYPSSVSGFVTATDGDCSTSISIDANCGTNISVSPATSQTADAGTTGTHTYTISWLGGGPNCISDFDVIANYNCPKVCPDEANISTTLNTVCGGDMVTITGATVGNGSTSFIITESTGTITGITAGNPITIPNNTTCAPITYTFNATAICLADGSAITTGNFSLDIIAYPSDISSLISTVENGCTTEVIIDDSCLGSVLVEPSLTQTAELGTDEGMHNYTVSWVADDFDCIATQNISLNYSCACEFDPTLARVEKVGGNDPINKICYGGSLTYQAIYDDLIIDLNDGGIDTDYSAAFVIFIEPIDFVVPPSSEQIQRITNDNILINDGSIPPGRYYIHYFQSRDILDPTTDPGECTLISSEYCEIAILEQLTVESTTCSGFENNNEVIITVTGGDTDTAPNAVYLDDNGTQFNPASIEITMDSVRIITFSNLPDGDYMFFYEDASACAESLLLELNCTSSEFDCPSELVTTDIDACAGEVIALNAIIVGQSEFTTITWLDDSGTIISDPANVQLPTNESCSPINEVYTIEVTCTQNPNFITLSETVTITIYPTDVAAFVTPLQSDCVAMVSVDASCGDLLTYTPVTVNPGETGTIDLTINYVNSCVSPFTVTVNYNCPAIMGCTDPCAPNFNATAMQDDGSCASYNNTCNQDCTLGAFGGTWDSSTCACINEITPINGCTDATACNYDALANCDDGNCSFGNTACADPCNEPNPDDGCDLTTDTFDATTCTVINEPLCSTGTSFNASTCNCDADEECVPPTPGVIECE